MDDQHLHLLLSSFIKLRRSGASCTQAGKVRANLFLGLGSPAHLRPGNPEVLPQPPPTQPPHPPTRPRRRGPAAKLRDKTRREAWWARRQAALATATNSDSPLERQEEGAPSIPPPSTPLQVRRRKGRAQVLDLPPAFTSPPCRENLLSSTPVRGRSHSLPSTLDTTTREEVTLGALPTMVNPQDTTGSSLEDISSSLMDSYREEDLVSHVVARGPPMSQQEWTKRQEEFFKHYMLSKT